MTSSMFTVFEGDCPIAVEAAPICDGPDAICRIDFSGTWPSTQISIHAKSFESIVRLGEEIIAAARLHMKDSADASDAFLAQAPALDLAADLAAAAQGTKVPASAGDRPF